jgi:hypothetical protein
VRSRTESIERVKELLLEWLPFIWVPAVISLITVVMVWSRIARSGIQHYGLDGAPWIEHEARMRFLETWRASGEYDLLSLIRQADGYFPPVMHAVTTPLVAPFGHTDVAAAYTMVLWLLLLAAAVGVVGYRLSGDRSVASAAAVGTLLVPALHGFATRYYYDVPMTAALWVVVAAILVTWDRWPLLGGVLVGLLWVGADLVKWTSLIFGVFMVVGAWTSRTYEGRSWLRRTAALTITGVLSAALLGGYLIATGPEGSLRVMLDQMWGDLGERAIGGGIVSVAGVVDAVTDFVGQQGWRFGTALPDGKWRFYPGGLVTSVLSPLLTLPVLALGALWAVRSRRGLGLFAVTILGQWLFVMGWVPVIDERFLITLVPCFVLAAAIGWRTLGFRARRLVGVAVVLAGLWVGAEFHFGVPPLPVEPVELIVSTNNQVPSTTARGLGLADSIEQRGWARWDTEKRVGFWERENLWRTMLQCGSRLVLEGPGVRDDERALGAYWVGYRSMRRELVEGERDRFFSFHCRDHSAVGLAVTRHLAGDDPEPGPCLGDRPWELWTTAPAPASTDRLAFWTLPAASGGCTAAPPGGG